MKKIKIICFIFISLLLVGCSQSNDINTIDMNDTSKIIEKNLKNMKEVNKTDLEDIYSLDLSNIDEIIVKENSNGDLYAIVKAKDIQSVKESMNDYFEKIKQFNQSYSPERLEILENRLEKQIGNYLIYIVAKDADKIYDNITNNLG